MAPSTTLSSKPESTQGNQRRGATLAMPESAQHDGQRGSSTDDREISDYMLALRLQEMEDKASQSALTVPVRRELARRDSPSELIAPRRDAQSIESPWSRVLGSADSRERSPGAAKPPKLRKILSLDGGGVRGLSIIIILKYIMRNLNHARGVDLDP